MYEDQSYESIMRRIMARVPANIDKREGSMIWDATGPTSVEIAILYTALDFLLQATFADTAPREYLIRRAAERGLTPFPATLAVFRADFDKAVPIGARFSLSNLYYTVTERLAEYDTPTTMAFRVQCETVGRVGNTLFGSLIPVEYIDGLAYAELTELLIPGTDEEETEAFRKRYFDDLKSQAFGGNQADYKEKTLALPGVGGVKVYREWNGHIRPADLVPPESFQTWFSTMLDAIPQEIVTWLATISSAALEGMLTVGGAIRLVIMDSAYAKPSDLLISDVQAAIDPTESHGEGLGIAPIGHFVSVTGVGAFTIDIATEIVYQNNWEWPDVEPHAIRAIDAYFEELSTAWDNSDALVVRISQIETRLIGLPGVVDVGKTTLNGLSHNLVLGADDIPLRGELCG